MEYAADRVVPFWHLLMSVGTHTHSIEGGGNGSQFEGRHTSRRQIAQGWESGLGQNGALSETWELSDPSAVRQYN
jgi:hypothetical protein